MGSLQMIVNTFFALYIALHPPITFPGDLTGKEKLVQEEIFCALTPIPLSASANPFLIVGLQGICRAIIL